MDLRPRDQVCQLDLPAQLVGGGDRGSLVLDDILQDVRCEVQQDVVQHQGYDADIRVENLIRDRRDGSRKHAGKRANDDAEDDCDPSWNSGISECDRDTGRQAAAEIDRSLSGEVELVDCIYKAHAKTGEDQRNHQREDVTYVLFGVERPDDEQRNDVPGVV